MKFAMVSRHPASAEQIAMMGAIGIALENVGDRDAFGSGLSAELEELKTKGFEGVVVVHPLMALKARDAGLKVAVFENGNRAPVGAPPEFFPKSVTLL